MYQNATGLWRVRTDCVGVAEIPEGLRPPPHPVAVAAIPSFLDQLYSFTTANELISLIVEPELADYLGGMPVLTHEDIVEIIRTVPLEPAIRLSVWVQRRLRLYPTDHAKQLETMGMLYGPVFRAAGELLLREFPRRSLFSEQQAAAWQRLLLLHAEDRPAEELTTEEQARVLWAFLWIPDAVLDPDLEADAGLQGWELADERFLRFFVSNGGYAGHAAFRHELARAHRLYHVIANSRAARRHHDFCPLDEWLLERYGVNFVELQTLGFAFFARSNVGDRNGGQLLFTNEEYFASTGLAGRYPQAVEAIAAPREWFEAEFAASHQGAAARGFRVSAVSPPPGAPSARRQRRRTRAPGARGLAQLYGCVLPILRSCAKPRRRRDGAFPPLQRLAAGALPPARHAYRPPVPRRRFLAGSGRVCGEQRYKVRGRGELMTSDVAIDLGLDLVLVELTTKRMTQRSVVDGDIESVVKDVRAMIVKKMAQLGRVIADLDSGIATLPDVPFEFVERVWPIVVVPDGLFHTPTLWAWVNEHSDGSLATPPGRKARTQPLVVVDAEEYEVLMALVEGGASLTAVLELKTTTLWGDRDFKSMFLDLWWTRDGGDLAFIGEEVRRNYRAMRRVLTERPPGSDPTIAIDLAA